MVRFALREADIRLRGDDVSIRTYLNKRYPTVRAGDPYHEVDYRIKFYITDDNQEENHIVRHHEMFQGLIDQSEGIKILFICIHSWMKHNLYDPSISFDMFSSYEIQILFLSFLQTQKLIELAEHDEELPDRWINVVSEEAVQANLHKLYIDFLKSLVLTLSMRETYYSSAVHPKWLKTAFNPDE